MENTDRPAATADPAPMTAEDLRDRARLYPRVTSFRSRRGSLTPAQQHNWETLWPIVGRDATDTRLDLEQWFGRSAPVIMEIGSGTGTSTAAMAKLEPEIDVLAVEVYKPGLAQLLGFIEREGIDNIRIVRGDAVVVLREMVPTAFFAGIRIFFPDPWPKARHHKRRLIQSGTLGLIADAVVDDGVVHIATDHADYAEWIADELSAQELLVPLEGEAPFSLDRPTTKFEGRADREGRSVTEFVLRRIPRAGDL